MTVSVDLVQDGDKFFELCERCVGSNFMRVPLSFKRIENRFHVSNPSWFEPKKPTSMAEWLLFFLERALWTQFKANVEQQSASAESGGRGSYRSMASSAEQLQGSQQEVGMERLLQQKDAKNQPLFLPTLGKTISFKEQILPYWSQVCKEISDNTSSAKTAENSLSKLQAKFKQQAES